MIGIIQTLAWPVALIIIAIVLRPKKRKKL
jgi:hypothetical protein